MGILHKNTDTSNYPPYVRIKIHQVEGLVRLGQRLGIKIYTNCFYESDFLQ